jgi:SAM-dependent methyltransferase
VPTEQDAHDRVAYPAYVHPSTHPDTLAVIAMLHSLDPAPIERCRVLEIGCNEGANLIPMAYAIPGSTFVGFDLAGLPIARGQQRIRELGLTNIDIFQADIMDVDEALGTFDYIIAHGVYAWVPEPVRARLLTLCREHLAPNGVAFLSYNALPGGHLKNMLRDLLLQGMTNVEDPTQAVTQSFDFLELAIESRPLEDPLRALFARQLKRLRKRGPSATYHDELSGAHRPVSFAEFMSHAAANNLQYLGESSLPPSTDPCYKPQIADRIKQLAPDDLIAQEQLFDAIRMRMYRETLLCHAERTVNPELTLEHFGRLRLASRATVSPGSDPASRCFTLPGGTQIESRHPATTALLEYLISAWPASIPFPQVAQFLAAKGIAIDGPLFILIFQLVVSRTVELHAWTPPLSRDIASHPRASAIARHDAVTSDQVTTLLHATLFLHDPPVRQLLPLLDGTRDRAALLQSLQQQNADLPEATLADGLEAMLRLLNQTGVLLAEDFTHTKKLSS